VFDFSIIQTNFDIIFVEAGSPVQGTIEDIGIEYDKRNFGKCNFL